MRILPMVMGEQGGTFGMGNHRVRACYPPDRRKRDMTNKLKTANEMLEELILYVRPPRGCAIVLTEMPSISAVDPNWVAASGIMDATKIQRFTQKISELRKSDPQIDWTKIQIRVGNNRRIAHWLSEVEPQ